jgi:type IV secretion system protein TrbI
VTEDFNASSEHLELRTRPRPIRKINKRALLLGCAVLAIVIGGATVVAFNPARVLGSIDHEEFYNTERKQTAEGLERLPKSYADLATKPSSPPSADVGRLTVENDKKVGEPSSTSAQSNLTFIVNPEEEAERAERMRQMRLAAQARESDLFVRLSEKNDGHRQTVATSEVISARSAVVHSASADDHEALAQATALARGLTGHDGLPDRTSDNIPSSQAHKLAFVGGKAEKETTNPHDLAVAPSPYTLMAGSLLAAGLVTGLNSDLPGMVIAQITENIFDTVTGEHLLIPQGTRLMGKYDSVVAFGQKRALVVWNRIILPNGDSVAIDNLPATDAAGYAGLEDDVDLHSWQLLKGIGLATVFGISSELALGTNNDTIVQALRQSVQTNTNQAGQRMVERELDVQPTVTVRPGWPVRVIVAKDLVLKPYRDARSLTKE